MYVCVSGWVLCLFDQAGRAAALHDNDNYIVVDGLTFDSGLPISAKMLVPPEEWPISVTRSGSPPKARMCFCGVVGSGVGGVSEGEEKEGRTDGRQHIHPM